MTVPNRYIARYARQPDGSFALEAFEAYDKQKYYRGEYVSGWVVIHGEDELDGLKNAIADMERRARDFEEFTYGFTLKPSTPK
jgi:hypothetical protein